MDTRSTGSPVWFKSTRCEANHCVEIARMTGGAAMRNSTRPDVHLTFPTAAWATFVSDIRTGRFDGPGHA